MINQNPTHSSRQSFLRWRVVLLCFLAQNCTMGFAFGSFGPLLASNEEYFGVTRAVAATGMSLITLAIGVLSPVLGGLLQRISIRAGMIAGAIVSAIGYWGLALLTSFSGALAMFVLIGTGVCFVAILGPVTLISRWFTTNRGKLLSIVNLPIVLFITPYLIAELLPIYGRFIVLAIMGTIFLLLAPLLLLIVERPQQTDQTLPDSIPGDDDRTDKHPVLTTGEIMRSRTFWLLSLGIGVIAGSGTAFVVHIIPFGMEKQMSLQTAAGLLSVYAGAGIFGTLLFGWIADRIGPPAALTLTAVCQSLLWWALLQVNGTPLFLIAALLGICVVPLVTLHGAALSALFGAANISRAMGYSYSIKLPFLFGFAPLIGFMFDLNGNYHTPFLLTAGSLAIASVLFFLITVTMRKPALATN